MDVSTFRAWITEATRLVVDNTDHLTHLDAAIGDADHGINLRRGFEAAQAMLDETSPATPGAVLTTVGRALISKTGGASGPLYGTGFRQAGKTLGEDPDVSAIQLGTALAAALAGIRQLSQPESRGGPRFLVDFFRRTFIRRRTPGTSWAHPGEQDGLIRMLGQPPFLI